MGKLFDFEKLETLILTLRETKISTGDGLRKLSNVFQSLTNLKIFNIELYDTETNSESVINLLNSLTKCKKLEKLFLGLGETNIFDSLKPIGKILTSFKKLKSF